MPLKTKPWQRQLRRAVAAAGPVSSLISACVGTAALARLPALDLMFAPLAWAGATLVCTILTLPLAGLWIATAVFVAPRFDQSRPGLIADILFGLLSSVPAATVALAIGHLTGAGTVIFVATMIGGVCAGLLMRRQQIGEDPIALRTSSSS